MNKKIWIKTLGCQMNVADSERILATLEPLGYQNTEQVEEADLILLNTCSVRDKPEHKTNSLIGSWAQLKRQNPELKIVVTGCVAQQLGKDLLKSHAHLDWVLGPDDLLRLPSLLKHSSPRQSVTQLPKHVDPSQRTYNEDPITTSFQISKYVVVMKGCDQFCTYCIVPFTRGRERSRSISELKEEAITHIRQGTKEIVLLGQIIDTYGKYSGVTFADLLKEIHAIEGLKRLRFLTSHPRYFGQDLIACFAELPKLCNYLHLPVQSGSNRMLEKMNRHHSRESYLKTIQDLRSVRPDLAISSDFIVGFPGETEEDFHQTLDLVDEIQYDQAFSFMYSPRPGTKSADWEDDVPLEVKKERLSRLQDVLMQQVMIRNQRYLHQTVEVLVEGHSTKHPERWTGRSESYKIVNFEGAGDLFGSVVPVFIERALTTNLQGTLVDETLTK